MNTSIPALSIRQPFVWAILYAGKLLENRSWGTSYRGRLRLHASKTWDAEGAAFLHKQYGLLLEEADFYRTGELGAYLGEVTVVDCYRIEYPPRVGRAALPTAGGADPLGGRAGLLDIG